MRDFLDFEEAMLKKDEDGEKVILTDVGTAPSIFLSGTEIEVEGPVVHIIGWDHMNGLGDVRPEKKVAIRATITVEAARLLAAQIRKKLPAKIN